MWSELKKNSVENQCERRWDFIKSTDEHPIERERTQTLDDGWEVGCGNKSNCWHFETF